MTAISAMQVGKPREIYSNRRCLIFSFILFTGFLIFILTSFILYIFVGSRQTGKPVFHSVKLSDAKANITYQPPSKMVDVFWNFKSSIFKIRNATANNRTGLDTANAMDNGNGTNNQKRIIITSIRRRVLIIFRFPVSNDNCSNVTSVTTTKKPKMATTASGTSTGSTETLKRRFFRVAGDGKLPPPIENQKMQWFLDFLLMVGVFLVVLILVDCFLNKKNGCLVRLRLRKMMYEDALRKSDQLNNTV